MKRLTFLLLNVFLLFIFSNCDETEDPKLIDNITGVWKVVAYDNHEDNSSITKTNENSWDGADVTVSFFDKENGLYKITGTNTTNSIIGEYTYIGENNIKIIKLGGTYINQPEWGNLFSDAVYDFGKFENNGILLRIFYDNENKSVLFEKVSDIPSDQ